MRLGLNIGYFGAQMPGITDAVEHADRIGFDSLWAAEAYGSDAATVLAFMAARTERIELGSAILQIPARTPAMTAMTAMTIDALSNGRFNLGLGLSGPQVVEGWHGVPYGKPLRRTREHVEIVRRIIARERPVEFDGEEYQIPYTGPDAMGIGKPLKSILHPVRDRIPVYLAAVGPKNVALTAEIADGWLPIFFSPEREELFTGPLDEGLSRAGRDVDDVDVAATVHVVMGDDVDACRDMVRPIVALYVGGMGGWREKNFYYNLACRYGFEQAATEIQDLYWERRRDEAAAAVPAELIDEIALVGPEGRIRERLDAWKASRVTHLLASPLAPDVSALEVLRDAID